MYFLLREKIPFFEQVPLFAEKVKHIKDKSKRPPQIRKISSPKVLRQFTPVGHVIRRNSYYESRNSKTPSAEDKSGIEEHSQPDHTLETPAVAAPQSSSKCIGQTLVHKQLERRFSGPIRKLQESAYKKSRFYQEAEGDISPLTIEETKDSSEPVLLCKCGKLCVAPLNVCAECHANGQLHEAAGYLYLMRDARNLDRYWFQLVNKELYCKAFSTVIGYRHKDDKDSVMMINVAGQFIQEESEVKIDSRFSVYPFTLCTRWDRRTIYCIKPEERRLWVDTIRRTLGYADIYKTYELGVRGKKDV